MFLLPDMVPHSIEDAVIIMDVDKGDIGRELPRAFAAIPAIMIQRIDGLKAVGTHGSCLGQIDFFRLFLKIIVVQISVVGHGIPFIKTLLLPLMIGSGWISVNSLLRAFFVFEVDLRTFESQGFHLGDVGGRNMFHEDVNRIVRIFGSGFLNIRGQMNQTAGE